MVVGWGIESDHPLFKTPYLGQVVCSGLTPKEALKERSREHISDTLRCPKSMGLYWTIHTFEADAFTICIVEARKNTHVEAME